jgi:hypothetical protein
MTNETQDDLFDPAKFRVTDAELPGILAAVPKKQPKPKKRARKFTMFPLLWEEKLTEARHLGTYRVALHLLHRAWRGKGEPILLANGQLATKGVTRRTKWLALAELERLGLIVVERRPRKSPIITILATE